MIFENNSQLMLKYQKAKAKLVEYNLEKQDYPHFPLDSNELIYSTTYILSKYAESIIQRNIETIAEFQPYLNSTAQYFDAAINSQDRDQYDIDFLLSGAVSFFFSNDLGSSKVLTIQANKKIVCLGDNPRNILLKLLKLLLTGETFKYEECTNNLEYLNNYLLDYFNKGKNKETFQTFLSELRKEIYDENIPENIYYYDLLYAVIIKAISISTWVLLPKYTNLCIEKWDKYLSLSSFIKILWPAQKLLGEKGVLAGNNAIIQLPTGVGKTKSIELIIRSSFLLEHAKSVVIIAPLKALCNEITSDMMVAFKEDAFINQLSDVLQEDYEIFNIDHSKNQIIVCTPEKLSYIIQHNIDVLELLDLFIIDEGHMFDDGVRGALFELLITHIKNNITNNKQLVLLSAVLPNASVIQEWLFDGKGIVANNNDIVSTPKSIGFTSKEQDIFFYSDDKNKADFYVPRIIKTHELNALPHERSKRFFPNLENANDVAIYNALKLCMNGGVAIYMSQQRYIKTLFERIQDLLQRKYDLLPFIKSSSCLERTRMSNFIAEYYGQDHIYSIISNIGVLPHSSNLPNGIKLSVEYALKHNLYRVVVCTSTLAQGVNIPIKYLLITSLYSNRSIMKTRNFQNLIGRTARSGMYTEGSIIITESKIFDNKNDYIHGGSYRWNECVNMFDKNLSEPCCSSILLLVRNITLDYEFYFSGVVFAKYIINNYNGKESIEKIIEEIKKAFYEKNPDKKQDKINEELIFRYNLLCTIENYLMFSFRNHSSDEYDSISKNVCKKTLAYFLAEPDEKQLLEELFIKLSNKIQNYNSVLINRYYFSHMGIEQSIAIEKWIETIKNNSPHNQEVIESLFETFNIFYHYKQDSILIKSIFNLWIQGISPKEISFTLNTDINTINDICNKYLSYDLNMFIGNICDVIKTMDTFDYKETYTQYFTLLQQKVKYGVPCMTAISICEKVFNDRVISIKIEKILNDENICGDAIIEKINEKKDIIFKILAYYPEFFENRLHFLLD